MLPMQIGSDEWRPLKRVEYEHLIRQGVFDHEKVELIRGVIVRMSPQYPPHSSTVNKLHGLLRDFLRGKAVVYCQATLALSDDSMPEPDVFVVPLGNYDHELPSRPLLVCEVADSTTRYDRVQKAPLYAAAGVPEYWLVDVNGDAVEVYREPGPDGCKNLQTHRRGETIAPTAFPDARVALADFLPVPL